MELILQVYDYAIQYRVVLFLFLLFIFPGYENPRVRINSDMFLLQTRTIEWHGRNDGQC
jgi:hypothetical protein